MSLVIRQNEREVQLSFEFHSRADMEAVRLVGARVERAENWDQLKEPLTIALNFDPGNISAAGEKTEVQTVFRFEALDSSDPKVSAITVECTFAATYQLAAGYRPTPDQSEAFRRGNAIFNAWPFFREYVQSTVARMNLPVPPVPFLRLAPIGKEAGEAEKSGGKKRGSTAKKSRSDGGGRRRG